MSRNAKNGQRNHVSASAHSTMLKCALRWLRGIRYKSTIHLGDIVVLITFFVVLGISHWRYMRDRQELGVYIQMTVDSLKHLEQTTDPRLNTSLQQYIPQFQALRENGIEQNRLLKEMLEEQRRKSGLGKP